MNCGGGRQDYIVTVPLNRYAIGNNIFVSDFCGEISH
jgi:hypothetical protein